MEPSPPLELSRHVRWSRHRSALPPSLLAIAAAAVMEMGVGRDIRGRVTFDLRGMGPQLLAAASARKVSAAAVMRSALIAYLRTEGNASQEHSKPVATPDDAALLKITLRLPASHAAEIARRARAADVSQGAYVAALVDGLPPQPLARHHDQAVAALMGSTDELAAISTDLNAFMRLLSKADSAGAERYRDRVMSLADDVRRHLALAASLMTELKPARLLPPTEN